MLWELYIGETTFPPITPFLIHCNSNNREGAGPKAEPTGSVGPCGET